MKLQQALVALLLIAPAAASVGADAGDDAKALYRFDAADEYAESDARFARDASGNGYDARAVGTDLTDGRHGEGYRFDGFEDYVRVPTDITHGLDEGTIALWLRLDHVDEHQKVFVKNWPGSFTYLAITVDAGGHVRFAANSLVQLPNVMSETPLEAGQWHHLAVTWSDDGKRVFIDGALDASDPFSFGVGGSSSAIAMLGNDPNAYWKRGMWGVMDEVRFYDRALDAHEVAALAGEAAAPPFAHACVAWETVCVDVAARALDGLTP